MKRIIMKYRYILLVLLVSLIACYPILLGTIKVKGDFTYHLCRIESLYLGIMRNDYPLKIHDIFFDGYGYPVGIFYPNLLLMFPAILRTFDIPLISAYNISIVVYTLMTSFSMYFSFKYISQDKRKSFIASAFYTLAAYRSSCLFFRGAYSEGLAFIFIPIIIAGIYDLIKNERPRWYILTIGFTGLLLTHLITFVIMIIVSAIIILINYRKVLDTERIKSFIISTLSSLGLTAYFLVPFIRYYFNEDWHFNYPWAGINDFSTKFLNSLSFYQLEKPSAIFEIPGFGLAYVIILLLVAVNYRKYLKNKLVKTLFGLSLALWIFTLDINILDPLRNLFAFMQFPFRVSGLTSACISMLAGIVLSDIRYRNIILTVMVLLLSNAYLQIADLSEADTNFDEIVDNLGFYPDNTYNEFLPAKTAVFDIYNKGDYIWNSNEDLIFETFDEDGKFRINFSDNFIDNSRLEIPKIYYEGYKAVIYSGDEVAELELTVSGMGYVVVHLGNYQYGEVLVYFEDPLYMKISYLVSLSTMALIIGYLLIKKIKSSNRSR